jgi:threonine/homoserine/homoserine lactone efflux protein
LFDLILKGIITGFILSVMIGPVFFVLLETSIRKGIRAGVAFDFGVFVSDVIYILIAFLFYNEVKLLAEGQSREIAKGIGGVLFIVYGSITFFKTPKNVQLTTSKEREPSDWKEYRMLCLKGFLLNLANPLVIFYWFSVLSLGDANKVEGWETRSVLLVFICIILMTFFSIDTLKILGAKQLRPFITDKLLKALNQLIGIVFMVFGVVLLVQGLLDKM